MCFQLRERLVGGRAVLEKEEGESSFFEGAVERVTERAGLDAAVAECGGRETFHRACWSGERVQLVGNQDSGAQNALAQADLLVRQRPNSPRLEAGELVQTLAF